MSAGRRVKSAVRVKSAMRVKPAMRVKHEMCVMGENRVMHVLIMMCALGLMLASIVALSHTAFAQSTPGSAGGPSADRQQRHRIRLLFTGNTNGYIDPCDCGGALLGGLDHRAAAIRDIQDQNRPIILFDLGNVFEVPRGDEVTELWRRQSRYISSEMSGMDYEFMALGDDDLALEDAILTEYLPRLDFRPLLTNRTSEEADLIETIPRIRIERGGLKLDFFNVVEPDLVAREGLLLPWRDILTTRLRESEQGDDPADLQIVIAYVDWDVSEAMPEEFPEIDVIFNATWNHPRQGIRVGDSVAMTAQWRGQSVAQLDLTSRSLASQESGRSAILGFQGRHIQLKQTADSDASVYGRMTALIEQLRRDNLIPPGC
ncbi:hypothetical protein ACFL6R_00910 [Gemmatimonadota bacterium]